MLLIVGMEYSDMAEVSVCVCFYWYVCLLSLFCCFLEQSGMGFWLWQLFVCCYCFTCGYSHFVWFCMNGDYTLARVIKVHRYTTYMYMYLLMHVFVLYVWWCMIVYCFCPCAFNGKFVQVEFVYCCGHGLYF